MVAAFPIRSGFHTHSGGGVNGRAVQSYGMAGSGGNKVFVLPELDAVVVITTTNFQVRDAHPLSEKLLTSLIMPVLMRP